MLYTLKRVTNQEFELTLKRPIFMDIIIFEIGWDGRNLLRANQSAERKSNKNDRTAKSF